MLQGVEYVFEPNWGEQLSSVELPVPVVFQLASEECTVVDVSKVGNISGMLHQLGAWEREIG